ncbi:MAG: AI-2E family transporter [Candidatus Firestonebacteria bacterium]
MMIQNLKVLNWIKLIIVCAGILLALFIFYLAQDLLTPFLIAFILVYILNPLTDKLEGKGIKRSIAVSIIFISIFLIFFVVLLFSYDSIFDEVNTLKGKVPSYFNNIKLSLEKSATSLEQNLTFLPKGSLKKIINEKSSEVPQIIEKSIPSLIMQSFRIITGILIILFTTFFLLKDGRAFRKNIIKIIPNKYFETFLCLLYEINKQIGNYIRGQLTDCIIVGILSVIGLYLIGLKYAIIVGTISGITNIVPYLGPVMGMIPGIFIAVIEHQSLVMAIQVVVVLIIVQLIDNALVSPLVVGKSVNLHPLAVILSVAIGGALIGFWGMLLAVPIFCTLKVTFETLYRGIIKYGSWET